MSNLFKDNRDFYHTFSRVAIQEGQSVAAAVNKTGHTVSTDDVWADIDKLPKNTTYFGNANAGFDDLKAVYDANAAEYSKYITLYDKVDLSPVAGSGQDANKNQAWELLVGGKRVKNFVAPTDVFDADGKPCNGYTLKLFNSAGTQIAATDGNWAFDYVAGLVIFERGKTPEDMEWATTVDGKTTAPIKMSAWAYSGEMLTKKLTKNNTDITAISGNIAANTADITAISGNIAANTADITAISGDITTIEGDITTINNTIADLTIQAGAKELLTVNATIPVSGAITGNGISGTVTNGVVSALVAGEVMLTKQAGAEITPDMSYVSGVTTLEADYGTTIPTSGLVWEITYRV